MRKPNSARTAAITSGKLTYITGKPCKHGHAAPRYVANHACTVCCSNFSTVWNKKNPEKMLEAGRKTYAKDPSKAAARYAKRRASKKQATPSWADFEHIQTIYALAKQKTLFSGVQWEVDHIVPLNSPFVCGLHVSCNLQIITKTENRKKQNKMLDT